MRLLLAGSIIGAIALLLRVWGIGFGLPELLHPDEPAYVLQALAVGRGLPDGLTFANPPLFKYLLLAEYAATYALQRLSGTYQSPAELVERFRADPSLLYSIARLTSALLGVLTVGAAGVLGAVTGGRGVGLLSAGLCAVTYLLVREAHFGVDDTLVTLLVTLGLVACVRIVRGGGPGDYVAAGAMAGLAFAAKYDGIALLAPLVLAHVTAVTHRFTRSPLWRDWAPLLVALAACGVAAVVAFPSLVTEPGRVLGDVYVHLYLAARGGYDGLDPSGGYVFYARALGIGLGWPLLAAAVFGIGLSVWRRDWAALVVATLPVSMLLVLGSQQLYFARFALPVIPALLVQASLALDWLRVRQVLVGAVAVALVAMPTLVDAARFDGLLTQTDTRTQAREWMAGSLPREAVVAVDAPPLGPSLAPGQATFEGASDAAAVYDVPLAEYRTGGVDFVVTSSFVEEAPAVEPGREARRVAFDAALAEQATLVAQFRPYAGAGEPPFAYDQIYGPYSALDRLERPGPTVTIYRLSP